MNKVISKSLILLVLSLIVLAGCNKNSKNDNSNNQTDAENLQGDWHGNIDVPNQPLPIQVTFGNEDHLNGKISIPIQGVSDYPLSKVKLDDGEILFAMDVQGELVTFDGEVEQDKIEGSFEQHGQTFPFELEKGKVASEDDEDNNNLLTVETERGKIYGELEIPEQSGEAPYPVMIIIPGSGPTDRNGNTLAGDNNSLKYLSEELAERGVASIRYDKPGAGKNTDIKIPEEEITFDQFVEDAVAWIDLAEKDDRFTEIGIIGHSQGSLEGILAAQEEDIDVFISLAGVGNSIDKTLYNQLEEQLPENLLNESEEIIAQLKKGHMVDELSPELEGMFHKSVQPFLISWMAYEPAEELKKLSSPTLIINGTRDLQTPEHEAELLHEASDASEFLLIEKMNHVLKEAPTDREGNLKTYTNPDLPLADGLIEGIAEFLINEGFIKQ
ncbi:S9 family peptidase [Virgibacillus sp. MSJ-26]|uniref:alpha/beta hydrolase family protein n=1 Tax=Virgibacillus sp. MSJ-26 TaxID=2841522 RepID=UPI00209EF11F|nr:alpha/beta hydrolase [Virgibacillus sp. MSJ-26]